MVEHGHKECVLVVDDEPQILTAITDLLEDEFTVFTAETGARALEILASQEMAVVLSDQRMPGMTGAELLSHVREASDATRVLVTGYSDLDALVKAVNLGQIHAYLSKPWNPLELKVVVRTAADRWRLGRKLEHERNLLRSLMNSIPDAIFFKDSDLRFTQLNPIQAALIGVDGEAQAVGRTLSELVPGPAVAALEAAERQLLTEGGASIDDIVGVTDGSGNQAWYSHTKVPLHEKGTIVGLVGFARDVTKRKQAEDYLRHAHDQLQKAVDERTIDLQDEVKRRTEAEREARAARDVAEAASRAKTIFLANMSHELRTPLNAIIGFAELAETMMNPSELEKYGGFMSNVTESAHHLLRVINDILDVSRVEVGKVTLREVEVDIGEVIGSAVRLIGHVASTKRQSVTTSVPDGFPMVLADERLLKQILLNLVSNAAKFTPVGGHLSVEAMLIDHQVTVLVKDDGVGIDANDILTVLQPFGQVENKMAPKQEGTGLGLPLSKGFMELHGGTLSVSSIIDQGTTVTLTFPAHRTIPRMG
ncbi:hybrid sensor histidine kinase/response regulator [Magnetospirillum moscoviense]|uniref:histidine kinase n=1 Tax=Magnetospirillum moscoviense TaxID=1437059 RepID=A0A178N125_9PROT|nr:ATP-binding protein [Magnetospirillum moscoviense]MBF0323568.1 response regulator [Alphaproteobacteria bacterium]OAN64507.1 hybrid sensor histidine kinase/response regulator [Magnetospirillum moscoviense]